jgi:hypothetical protein
MGIYAFDLSAKFTTQQNSTCSETLLTFEAQKYFRVRNMMGFQFLVLQHQISQDTVTPLSQC